MKLVRDTHRSSRPGLDEVIDHLIDTAAGLQEISVLQQVLYPVGILAQTEEVCLLLRIHYRASAVRTAAVYQLIFGPEALTGLAVLALVYTLINITVFIHLAEDLLYAFHMIVIGGADKPVIGNIHQLPQILDSGGAFYNIVHKLLGSNAGILGLVLNLLTMLICTGQEHDFIALQPLVTATASAAVVQ